MCLVNLAAAVMSTVILVIFIYSMRADGLRTVDVHVFILLHGPAAAAQVRYQLHFDYKCESFNTDVLKISKGDNAKSFKKCTQAKGVRVV